MNKKIKISTILSILTLAAILLVSTAIVIAASTPTLFVSFGNLNSQNPIPTITPPVNTYTINTFVETAIFNGIQGTITNSGATVAFPDSNITVGNNYILTLKIRNVGNATADLTNAFVFSGTAVTNDIVAIEQTWINPVDTQHLMTLPPLSYNEFYFNVHVNTIGLSSLSLAINPTQTP